MQTICVMKRIIYFLSVFLSFISVFTAYAQQDLLLSQEIFSRVNKNPAATGNSNDVDIFLHGRIQWLGVDNGPRTAVLNVTDYEEKIHSGFGLSLSFDRFGIGHTSTNAKVIYSFQIDLSERFVLSLGLGSGVNIGGFDYSKNTLSNSYEYGNETYPWDKVVQLSPDFDFGFELANPRWTLGVSMTHLLNGETTTFKPGRHLYAYWTGLFPVGDNFDIAPLLSSMFHSQTQLFEVGSHVFFKRFIWGGAAFRPDFKGKMNTSVLALTLGFEKSKFRFGYSYDLGLGSDNLLPSNTHEVILSYGIAKKGK